jgi:hypothetical protein
MWNKARTQPSQGVADRPRVGTFPKNCFVYLCRRGGAQGIQCPKAMQVGNLAARPSCMIGQPDKWASCAQSLARAPPYS